MNSRVFSKFEIYWWLASDGPRLSQFSTKTSSDIEVFPGDRFRIRAKPFYRNDDEEEIELILFGADGKWFVKSDSFEYPSEEYPISYTENEETAIWIDAQEDELMVIKATLA